MREKKVLGTVMQHIYATFTWNTIVLMYMEWRLCTYAFALLL